MPDHLLDELRERHAARSLLFWKLVKDSKFAKLQQLARNAEWQNLTWDWAALGVTEEAVAAARSFGFVPTEVFAHPAAIDGQPELLEYYRLLACLPRKGLAQIRAKAESRDNATQCVLLNSLISKLLAKSTQVTREIILRTVFAEAGSEWQGTWVNNIGFLAAQDLEKLLVSFAREKQLVNEEATIRDSERENILVLKTGTLLTFGAEPDVECRNASGELVCVIEIKGSADKAGAQTRLGETKKSFAKAKHENPRCVTIFLPSIVTPSVLEQLKTERDVDKVFNLLEIFRDETKRSEFLNELFKYILREPL